MKRFQHLVSSTSEFSHIKYRGELANRCRWRMKNSQF